MDKNTKSRIINVIYTIIVLVVIYILFTIYKSYSYGEFTKAENVLGLTSFKRDKEITYTYDYSYKLESKEFNDAMFYKTINIKPNTPYKLTCMVKTENVETENGKSSSGAQIAILNTTESSKSIVGTNDWQKLEFIFDSKNRETIEIGFRLGGNSSKAKGTVWFSDFKLEEGVKDNSNNWNIACFIIKNLDVNINNKNVKISMSSSDIEKMKTNMDRFKYSAQELSRNKMTVDYDVYEIDESVQTITYSEEHGYYLDPSDVERLVEEYLTKEEYDYIFVATKLGDIEQNIEIPTYDWIGLGGMDLYGIGYSNIRLPNDDSNYIYTYDSRINKFPEEVFIHEFLHSLERIMQERNYEIPELHDYQKYGYKEERLIGLKQWYNDYMSCTIKKDNEYIGLDDIVYTLTPPAGSDFRYNVEIEFNNEPDNLIEEMRNLFKVVFKMFGMK